jgi:hypothetical protein
MRTVVSLCLTSILVVSAASRVPATAAGAAPATSAPHRTERQAADDLAVQIAGDLGGADETRQQQALTQIRAIAAKDPRAVRRYLRWRWLRPMLRLGRYDDVEELALAAILYRPEDSGGCSAMQQCRVEALLAAGRYERAVAEAKVYYNVCVFSEMDKAMELMTQALSSSPLHKDTDVARRFRLQQAEGAAASPAASAAGPAATPTPTPTHRRRRRPRQRSVRTS